MEFPIIRDGRTRRRISDFQPTRSRDRLHSHSMTDSWPRSSLFNATFGPWTGDMTSDFTSDSDLGSGNRREEVTFRLRPAELLSPMLSPTHDMSASPPRSREIHIPINVTSSSTSASSGTFPRSRDRRVIDSSTYVVGDHGSSGLGHGSLSRPSGRRALTPGSSRGILDSGGSRVSYGPVTYHSYDNVDNVTATGTSERTIPITRHDSTIHNDNVSNPVAFTNSDDDDEEDKDATSDLPKLDKLEPHVYENARAHHTDRFHAVHGGSLVVRRGQGFELTASLDRHFVEGQHDLKFVAETGTNPLPGKGTHVTFSLYHGDASGQWRAKVTRVLGHSVNVTIETPADAVVGDWRLTAAVASRKSGRRGSVSQSSAQIPVYILFNPWCNGDSVYFADHAKLSEYVLNDNGCIFHGTHNQIGANPWFFGQFEAGILEAAIYCLNKAFKFRSSPALGDPVRVTRAISKIVNSNDEGGVVVGNWSSSGSYLGGKAPLSWTGSPDILRQFARTHAPVKFGQCFVFSGVVTSICRALGIPCRSVTNFSSAHDTDASTTVDVHWDATAGGATSLDRLNTDSIWNFHVWNDVWMRRPDLAAGNDGWQVLDATPQEASSGVFQCGPAPLAAVRSGQCDVAFDPAFVFAEVNADRLHWGRKPGGDWDVIDVEKAVVGKKISTKVADGRPIPPNLSDCEPYREDITHQYKYPDESERERIAVINASRTTNTGRMPIHNRRKADVKLSIAHKDNVLVGSDFDISVSLENTCRDTRTVSGHVICDVVSYTGQKISSCRQEKLELSIEPRTVQNVTINISAQDYLQYVNEAAIIRISALARMKETGTAVALVDNFRLRVPDLQIKMLSSVSYVGSLLQFKVSWRNPLNKKLTGCVIRAECPDMEGDTTVPIGSIGALQDVQTVVGCRVQRPGLKQVYVTLDCDQLHNVKGVDETFVQGH